MQANFLRQASHHVIQLSRGVFKVAVVLNGGPHRSKLLTNVIQNNTINHPSGGRILIIEGLS
jgi:hypothetical protein